MRLFYQRDKSGAVRVAADLDIGPAHVTAAAQESDQGEASLYASDGGLFDLLTLVMPEAEAERMARDLAQSTGELLTETAREVGPELSELLGGDTWEFERGS